MYWNGSLTRKVTLSALMLTTASLMAGCAGNHYGMPGKPLVAASAPAPAVAAPAPSAVNRAKRPKTVKPPASGASSSAAATPVVPVAATPAPTKTSTTCGAGDPACQNEPSDNHGGSSGTGSGGAGWSDRRLKTDISRIGTSPSGVPIYIFRYIWGGPLYLGTMAQDLLATHPEAVIETASGYYMVDYTKLDIRMRALPEQAAGRHPAIVAGDVSEPRALVDDRVALPHGPLSREPGGPRRCHQQVSDRLYELS